MGKYGVKIKNYKAGSIYEYDLGVRDHYHFKNAMFTNSLFLNFLLENGLKEIGGTTRDIIGVNFDYGSKSYKEMINQTNKKIDECIKNNDENGAIYYQGLIDKIKSQKDNYDKKSVDELRIKYYEEGIDIKYPTYYKDKTLKKMEIIHYVMLYRSTGKAKEGSCVFISKRLYKKAINFLYMGLKLPKHNAPIVEISAYASLICSTIVDTIQINPKNILILKDVDSYFNTNVISVEVDKNKHCVAKSIKDYAVKNTLFDGQCLVDDKIFPKNYNNNGEFEESGAILLRHHMCKMGGAHTYIQKFFKDYFKDEYETAIIYDMWGNEHYAKDIEVITTDNAMKWIKFDIGYDYWCQKVNENNNTFGIVKVPHKSKLGDVQQMSYQMINALDMDIMPNVIKESKNYIESLKQDNSVFLQYLRDNANFSNDYEVLVALCEQNKEFTRSSYFRDRKKEIIRSYIANFRFGKVIQDADNLVIVGSPYAMLLYSVGEDVNNDATFKQEEGTIQCYTKRFKNGEYLAEFRSPFNSKNNMGCLHNVYSDEMEKYFDLGEQVIAVNMINTDFQDRNNGSDQDFDAVYCTNQKDIVEYSKYCYTNYPTIVNNIPKESKKYDNNLLNYALIDNNLASSQDAIGESSNMAQLALTYTYNFDDQKYQDYVCILSVLAQVAIDNAKRRFDVDLVSEINRIKKDMNIDEMKYPVFWKHAKDKKIKKGRPKFNKNRLNNKLKCPMNYLMDVKFVEFKPKESTLPMTYFFNKFELDEDRRRCKKVEDLIEKYSLTLYNSLKYDNDDELLLRDDFDKMIEDIQKIYISKSYLGLMSWLIDRAFIITDEIKKGSPYRKSQTEQNKAMLLKVLYNINSSNVLKIFSKNM